MPSRLPSAQVASALEILKTAGCCVSWMPERRTKTSRDFVHVPHSPHPKAGDAIQSVRSERTHAAATMTDAMKKEKNYAATC